MLSIQFTWTKSFSNRRYSYFTKYLLSCISRNTRSVIRIDQRTKSKMSLRAQQTPKIMSSFRFIPVMWPWVSNGKLDVVAEEDGIRVYTAQWYITWSCNMIFKGMLINDASVLALLIVSFVVGLLFAWCTSSLILLIAYMTIVELICFSVIYPTGEWSCFYRTGYIFSSILGWIIGRAIHKLPTFFLCKKRDKRYGLRLMHG